MIKNSISDFKEIDAVRTIEAIKLALVASVNLLLVGREKTCKTTILNLIPTITDRYCLSVKGYEIFNESFFTRLGTAIDCNDIKYLLIDDIDDSDFILLGNVIEYCKKYNIGIIATTRTSKEDDDEGVYGYHDTNHNSFWGNKLPKHIVKSFQMIEQLPVINIYNKTQPAYLESSAEIKEQIFEAIENGKDVDVKSIKLSEASKALLKTAEDRFCTTFGETFYYMLVACTLLRGYNPLEPRIEHIAETINFFSRN
jgi:hypothetical protein